MPASETSVVMRKSTSCNFEVIRRGAGRDSECAKVSRQAEMPRKGPGKEGNRNWRRSE